MSTSRSTAGPGFNFEDHVAAFILLQILQGAALPGAKFTAAKMQWQTKPLGWELDDLLAIGKFDDGAPKLAISCKSNVQVSGNGLPEDFVLAAWQQWTTSSSGPINRERDFLALATRGRHPGFHAIWTDIKTWCSSSDSAQALANINNSKKHRKVFDSVKTPGLTIEPSLDDTDVVALIRGIIVLALDFDLDASYDTAQAQASCRALLENGDTESGAALWEALIDVARDHRLAASSLELFELWAELRSRFSLRDHPDYAGSLARLRSIAADRLSEIETALPNGFELTRTDKEQLLNDAIGSVGTSGLFGDSGCGKSALVKTTLSDCCEHWELIWLSAEDLTSAMSDSSRLATGLTQPLTPTLLSTPLQSAVLVIDSAERMPSSAIAKLDELLRALSTTSNAIWRVIIVAQTDAWRNGSLAGLLESNDRAIEVGPLTNDEIKTVLLGEPALSWLATREESFPALANIRSLAWVIQAPRQFARVDEPGELSLPDIVDRLWEHWTAGRSTLASLLIHLAELEGREMRRGTPMSEIDQSQLQAFDSRPEHIPVQKTPRNHLKFQHDLAAEWSRYQRLKEIAHSPNEWAKHAANPVWLGSIRLLGQFLLRDELDDTTAWDAAYQELVVSKPGRLAADLLLDALCLDSNAEHQLMQRSETLFAEHGKQLNRVVRRFLHIATLPTGQASALSNDEALHPFIEGQFRTPVIARWPSMVHFLAAHRETVADLVSPSVAELCRTWLSSVPELFSDGRPLYLRAECAAMAVDTARSLQAAQGKSVMFLDDSEKPIYAATFAAAPDMPEEVAAWALEMAQRAPMRSDIKNKITLYRLEQQREHAEKMANDPEYQQRHERKRRAAVSMGSYRHELPPWPLGPKGRVESHFRECVTGSAALVNLMRVRPQVAAEVLLAAIIEDDPAEEYDPSPIVENVGIAYDDHANPTAPWRSPFLHFFTINSDVALDTLMQLVEFCTDRWQDNWRCDGDQEAPGISIIVDGNAKWFSGNYSLFDWVHTNSTFSGQLFSALAALEFWLTSLTERPELQIEACCSILRRSTSVSMIGVLLNVGKHNTDLFEGALRSLLGCHELYVWDDHRVDNIGYAFDAFGWARDGDILFELAKSWYARPYRHQALRQVANELVREHSELADDISEAAKSWQCPKGRKQAIEFRILKAELSPDNYHAIIDSSGAVQTVFQAPEELQQEVLKFQQDNAASLQALILPTQCMQRLVQGGTLSSEEAIVLAGAINGDCDHDADDDEHFELARVASASTLVTLGGDWLVDQQATLAQAWSIIREVLAKIPDGSDVFGGGPFEENRDYPFVVHALISQVKLHGKIRAETWHDLLRLLTSGDQPVVGVILSATYKHRDLMQDAWPRLLDLAILWSALALLAPHRDEEGELRARWSRWLNWLRPRSVTRSNDALPYRPLVIAKRAARLHHRRWVREEANCSETLWRRPRQSRWSGGLHVGFLQQTYAWLTAEEMIVQLATNDLEWENRSDHLVSLLEFEIWCTESDGDRSRRDALPTSLGYELAPAIAREITRYDVEAARALWQPLLSMGPAKHYFVRNFISHYLTGSNTKCAMALFSRHWRAMIEFALTDWTDAEPWHYRETLLCQLLGCGSETSLNQTPGIEDSVWEMRDLYERWAAFHLEIEEDNVAYLCNFVSQKVGQRLRATAVMWLDRVLCHGGRRAQWYRNSTTTGLTNFISTVLADRKLVATHKELREPLLRIIGLLVSRQVPTALVLQEKAHEWLAD